MVHLFGISNVSSAISKYSSIYEQISITFQIIHLLTKTMINLTGMQTVDIHLYFCIITYLCIIKGIRTYFKRISDPCWHITLSCSRKFLFNSNLTRSFLLFESRTEPIFSNGYSFLRIICQALSKFYPHFLKALAASKLFSYRVIPVNN